MVDVLNTNQAIRVLNDGKNHRFVYLPGFPLVVQLRSMGQGDDVRAMIKKMGELGIGVVEERGGVCKVIGGRLEINYTSQEEIVPPMGDEFEQAFGVYGVAAFESMKAER